MKKIKLSVVLFSLAAACTAFGYADCARCVKDSCERRMNSGDRDMGMNRMNDMRMNRMNNDNDMRMNSDNDMRMNMDSDRDIYRNRNVHLQIDTDKEMYRGSDAERRNVNRSINLNRDTELNMDSDSDMDSDSSDKMVSVDVGRNVNRSVNIDSDRNLGVDRTPGTDRNLGVDRTGSVNAPRPASMAADESGTSGDLDRSVNRSVRYDASRNVNAPVVDKSIQGFDY